MPDIHIRTEGRAGHITLARPQALNALTWDMCLKIEAALSAWRQDDAVALVILDAEGEKAFCAGGDIAEMYRTGMAGDYDYGRRFWRDEYRMNALLADYPKPIVAFLQGFTMGGGVGLGGHVSHRVVGDSAQISMPECSIGFVPDVGGSALLARAPGRLGAYLGLTATRMSGADAIHAGFADLFLSETDWDGLKAALAESGDVHALNAAAHRLPDSPLAAQQPEIDALFAATTLPALTAALETAEGDLASRARKALARNAPLSMAVTLEMLARLGPAPDIHTALELEYRVSHRIMQHGDFLEGIRAAIIDKDRSPKWRFAEGAVPPEAVAQILAPLGPDTLDLKE